MKYASLKILAILSAIMIVSPTRAGHAETGDTYEDIHDEEVIDCYQVKYRYNGCVYHTVTKNNPGRKIQVRVNVVPSQY